MLALLRSILTLVPSQLVEEANQTQTGADWEDNLNFAAGAKQGGAFVGEKDLNHLHTAVWRIPTFYLHMVLKVRQEDDHDEGSCDHKTGWS
jgi:hypothetical protein